MTTERVAHVVVAAGGLGTRAASWSQFLPKEFYPVQGRPGIAHLLDEIAAVGPARAAIVYHPYYETFVRWARLTLSAGAQYRYRTLARQPVAIRSAWADLDVIFVRQRGDYADITSVLNGAATLHPPGDLYLAFADNLYPAAPPMPMLAAAAADTVTVLARPFDLDAAAHRGVIICPDTTVSGRPIMTSLIEKPTRDQAVLLLDRYGHNGLRLMEGRARLTQDFVEHLRSEPPTGPIHEPKLSLALASYSRKRRVEILTTTAPVIDLGTTEADSRLDPSHCG
ncbi:glycosyltransferase family protein [Fodinicola feengrottensis]|uniref:MobA-like NTP transferase domain-containing protein n=1 Tax=Fodinicola feengrottensis TaxID=435914 RepID=A0ABN2FRK1_9ACTN|nr:transcriptional regulator [Fodinicola feengrottensis]